MYYVCQDQKRGRGQSVASEMSVPVDGRMCPPTSTMRGCVLPEIETSTAQSQRVRTYYTWRYFYIDVWMRFSELDK